MKNYVYIIIGFLTLTSVAVFGQVLSGSKIPELESSQWPKESVFLHINASLFMPGEQLLYSFYLRESESLKPSLLSKIGYVELVNSGHNSVFKHKLKLVNGISQGDFLIPNNLASGNYKLVGYTNWMRNFGVASFFIADISIVNPYKALTTNYVGFETSDNLPIKKRLSQQPLENPSVKTVLRQRVNKREKVKLTLILNNGTAKNSNLSISVRKCPNLIQPELPNAESDIVTKKTKSDNLKDNLIYIPEFRGELIGGRLIDIKTNKPSPNQEIAVSLSGQENEFKILNTNGRGYFFGSLFYDSDASIIYYKVLNNPTNQFRVEPIDDKIIDYKNLDFEKLTLQASDAEYIKSRSIFNQIENAFANLKKDSLIDVKKIDNFSFKSTEVFVLDEFSRFSTFEETAVEILNNVWVENDQNGEKSIRIRSVNQYALSYHPSLILLNGVFVEQHEDILNIDAKLIKEIKIIRNQYLYGSAIFNGIMIISTFDDKYVEQNHTDYTAKFDYVPSQRKKVLFQPNYNRNPQARVPDYRRQLLWLPNFQLKNNTSEIFFYTSDVSGRFQVSLEGFTDEGIPISIRTFFTVN